MQAFKGPLTVARDERMPFTLPAASCGDSRNAVYQGKLKAFTLDLANFIGILCLAHTESLGAWLEK